LFKFIQQIHWAIEQDLNLSIHLRK
jgi:hypothetical protein